MSDEQLARLESKVDGLVTGIGEVHGRLTGVDKRLAGVDERLAGVDERLAGVDERLAGVDGRLDGLTDSVAGLTASVSDLKTGQDVLRLNVAELQNGQVSRFARLEAHVGKVETNLETMSTKLGVGLERTEDHVKLLAEGHGGIIQQMDRRFDEQRSHLSEIIAPLVLSIGAHTQELAASRRVPRASGRLARRRAPRTRRRRT